MVSPHLFHLLFVAILVLALSLSIIMPAHRGYLFPCVEQCGSGSQSKRGLAIHQASCKQFKRSHILSLDSIARKYEQIEAAHQTSNTLNSVSLPGPSNLHEPVRSLYPLM